MDQRTSMKHVLFLVCALSAVEISSQIFYTPSEFLKGHMVDWSLKMYDNFGDAIPTMFGALDSVPILRERKGVRDNIADNDGTGLIALLPKECSQQMCVDALADPQCTDLEADDDNHVTKLVIRRTDTASWVVECRRFLKVVLPEAVGGAPGRRTLGDQEAERGRLTSEVTIEALETDASTGITNIKITRVAELQTPSLGPKNSTEDVEGSVEEDEVQEQVETPSADECHTLFNTDPHTFHLECCLKAGADIRLKDHRCLLQQLLQKAGVGSVTPDTKSDVANPVVFDEDISELGKTLDVLEDREEKNETENRDRVIIEEITQQKDGWRHEYYVVLGFFLVFTSVFLIIIAVLVYKLKKNKTVTSAPSSPGVAPSGLNLTQQRARGYSAIDDDEGDRAALTPATQQAQAFQY